MRKKQSTTSGPVKAKTTSKNLPKPRLEGDVLKKLQYEFLSSTSHQLRTPLATMQSSIDLLEFYIEKQNKARQLQTVNKIKKTLGEITDTLENITVLYKHQIRKQELHISAIELRKFFNELLNDITSNIATSHLININIDTQENIFYADSFVLKQILYNLISNSIKFSPNGGQILLSITKKPKLVEIVIKDEGIGIDKKDLKKLFQPFFRGKNAALFEGAGLGLAIVKRLTDLHKAKIECFSELNKGTEFKIIIPQKINK